MFDFLVKPDKLFSITTRTLLYKFLSIHKSRLRIKKSDTGLDAYPKCLGFFLYIIWLSHFLLTFIKTLYEVLPISPLPPSPLPFIHLLFTNNLITSLIGPLPTNPPSSQPTIHWVCMCSTNTKLLLPCLSPVCLPRYEPRSPHCPPQPTKVSGSQRSSFCKNDQILQKKKHFSGIKSLPTVLE